MSVKMRLQVFLAHSGVASRRKSGEIIEEGRVRVNGRAVFEKGASIDAVKDSVEVDGRKIKFEKKLYYVLNKPKGYLTTVQDDRKRRTVMDLLPVSGARLYPVGRLDKDTEGVLIFTNDGALAHKLIHPRFGVIKTYDAEVKNPEKLDLKKIEKGVFLDGRKTAPCRINVLRKTTRTLLLRIELHEGKKRQIRRMIARQGGSVVRLKRVAYAGIKTKKVPRGGYRPLTEYEINSLKKKVEL